MLSHTDSSPPDQSGMGIDCLRLQSLGKTPVELNVAQWRDERS